MTQSFRLLTVGVNGAVRTDFEALLRSALPDLHVTMDRGGVVLADQADAAARGAYDLILADIRDDPEGGIRLLRRLRVGGSMTPVVFYGCPDGVDVAVAMMREGAADCLAPGVTQAAVSRAVRRVLQVEHAERARRASEDALRLSEASLRALVERSADAILVLDDDGAILFANPAAADMFGRAADALLGQAFGFPLGGEDSGNTRIDLIARDGRPASADMRVVRTNWRGASAYLATLRDTTARDRAEEQLRRNGALLERLIAERTAELEAANRAKDQFMAVLSHELRTPLTPVLMAVSAMEHDPMLSAEHVEDVRMIRRNVELETKLIDDLLDLTRITNGKLQLTFDTVDAHDCVRRALGICESDVRGKGLELTLDLAAAHPFVRADAARVEQLLWNLVKNAVKFTPTGGRLTIRTADADAGRLRIEVSDTGIGIEPEVLPKLFRPFEQGSPVITRQYGGLGLGLVVSRGVIEAHGGTLDASSDGRNRGTTFTVHLPTADARGPAADAPARGAAPSAARPLRLLLVEDHEITLKVTARLLTKLGYTLLTASTVADALALLRTESFDLLLSDVGLPDGTGHDIMRGLRDFNADLPGIAVSGFGMEHDVQRSLEVGFAAHITKPIDIPTLEAAIRRAACA